MDKVVPLEIPVDDAARAKEFYSRSASRPSPARSTAALMRRTSDTPAPVITIGVDAIDEALKKIEAGGGVVVQPRTEIPSMGAFAYFKDTEGNVVGSWETF